MFRTKLRRVIFSLAVFWSFLVLAMLSSGFGDDFWASMSEWLLGGFMPVFFCIGCFWILDTPEKEESNEKNIKPKTEDGW